MKELEHLVHSFEAQKLLLLQQTKGMRSGLKDSPSDSILSTKPLAFPSVEFFSDPQFPPSQVGNKCTLKSNAGLADIEVIVIESHANLRILSKKNPRQLWKLVSGFQTLRLSILHLNVTSLDPLVLYSISAKVSTYSCPLSLSWQGKIFCKIFPSLDYNILKQKASTSYLLLLQWRSKQLTLFLNQGLIETVSLQFRNKIAYIKHPSFPTVGV